MAAKKANPASKKGAIAKAQAPAKVIKAVQTKSAKNTKAAAPTPKKMQVVKKKTANTPLSAREMKAQGNAIIIPAKVYNQPSYNSSTYRSILDEPEIVETKFVRYSDEELSEFKIMIDTKLDAARKEVAYLEGLLARKDSGGLNDEHDSYGVGQSNAEREQTAGFLSRQYIFIDRLEKALIRIANKTYGICVKTGKLIERARLASVPHTTLCYDAKLEQDQPQKLGITTPNHSTTYRRSANAIA